MLTQKDFLKKFGIAPAKYKKTGLDWRELQQIYADFEGRRSDLRVTGNGISERLARIPQVHSLKMRVKDSEHLIEKIIRKRIMDPAFEIGLPIYTERITDLVGVRALHLFKKDWIEIHRAISEIWGLIEKPTMYIRKGDTQEVPPDIECEVREHPFGYRSVHYLVKSQPTRSPVVVEIQVRTIFEEAWSEIDHLVRYPYDLDNQLLAGYLALFNRLAGNADEMGSYLSLLRTALLSQQEEKRNQEAAYGAALKELEGYKNDLKAETDERKRLEAIIERLENSQVKASAPSLNLQGSIMPNFSGIVFDPRTTTPLLSGIDNSLTFTSVNADSFRVAPSQSHVLCPSCGSFFMGYPGAVNTCPMCQMTN